MQIKNLRARSVVIADPNFPARTVGPNEIVDVPDPLGVKLAEQTDRWEPVNDDEEN